MPKLGVNIDHIATLREARGIDYPDPVTAALLCEKAGADSIVCHLREDRRHIKDADVYFLREKVKTLLNLEMSMADEIVDIACKIRPAQATLVPEKRQELTTEGGLDVIGLKNRLRKVSDRLKSCGIKMSVFIEPDKSVIDALREIGIGIVELHTGQYANAADPESAAMRLSEIAECAAYCEDFGIVVNAGHGLNYENVISVAKVKGVAELNIGHSIISYAAFYGLEKAVKDMKALIS